MKIFTDKGIRLQFIVTGAALLLFILLGQLFVKYMADEYKQNLISHDSGIVGHYEHGGFDTAGIIQAITAQKTEDEIKAGRKLLQMSGYTEYVRNSLIPEVEHFHQKFAIISFALSIVFSILIFLTVLRFTILRDKKIECADIDLQEFMKGNTGIRLKENEEGSLAKFFSSVNVMANSLTAHIVSEKQNKEFLKGTISDISHQLKTPLTALKMYNEIIQDEKPENDVIESFISKSGCEMDRMETLIQNLLKLARMDTGSIKLGKSIQNLKEFLQVCTKGFLTRAELENKSIFLECDEKIVFNFDEEWLLEAVGNIIKNAMDHTGANNRIEIRGNKTPVAIEIMIKDNGVGIHPEDIHHIFKRFYRSKFSKDSHGIGIGLALSRAIVENHGGTITVESELGKGTVFYLVFPKLSTL